MDAADALTSLGGTGTSLALVGLCGRRALQRAVLDGSVRRVARGRYVTATSDRVTTVVARAGGVRSGLAAAEAHGWGLVRRPVVLEVAVRPGRAVPRQPGVTYHRYAADPDEQRTGRTNPLRTVLRCATTLPFVEALAVADSALRSGDVARHELDEAAAVFRGHGAAGARRVARWADERAANALESALRGHLIDAGLRSFVPQHVVTGPRFFAAVDLADPERRIAVEADGFEVHGGRRQLARDLRRHDELAALGWVTLRFAWEHVMHEPGWVVEQVRAVVRRRARRWSGGSRRTGPVPDRPSGRRAAA